MKARDLMIPIQKYLRPEHSLGDAAILLRIAKSGEEKIGLKALPVLDDNGNLLGILPIGDILKAVYPKYMYLMDIGNFTWYGMAEDLARKVSGKYVKEFMTKDVITVKENSPIMEYIDHMLKYNVKRVPVLDGDNKAAGMLCERDMFYYIRESMHNENPEAHNDA